MRTEQQQVTNQDQDLALEGEGKDRIIKGHKYDGIREYDNPMPGWWVWLFWGTIIFSGIYIVGLHFAGFIDSYTDDLAQQTARIEAIRTAYAEANPSFEVTEEALAAYTDNELAIASGSQTFTRLCAACHGNQGQGLIGPNLTDSYWIHGGSGVDIFTVVSDGVPTAGMPGWANALTPEQRAEVVAYIRSIAGTNPPGAREPQGEPYEAL
jgi:cytochrome c oxidase cbb3-type subunit 3